MHNFRDFSSKDSCKDDINLYGSDIISDQGYLLFYFKSNYKNKKASSS